MFPRSMSRPNYSPNNRHDDQDGHADQRASGYVVHGWLLRVTASLIPSPAKSLPGRFNAAGIVPTLGVLHPIGHLLG